MTTRIADEQAQAIIDLNNWCCIMTEAHTVTGKGAAAAKHYIGRHGAKIIGRRPDGCRLP